MRIPIVIMVAAGVAACGPTPVDRTKTASPTNAAAESGKPTPTPMPTATPAAQAPALAIDGDGLRLVDPVSGRARPIAFGTPRSDVLSALARRGSPQTGTNAECGAGPLAYARFGDGLTLQFQDDRFVGWSVDRAGTGKIATMSGIGPGSTRAELKGAYAVSFPESTLGTEFAAGDMGGLLDGLGKTARVTALWAGVTCLFR